MAINRVVIKDFLVFKGEFALDFCPGVNVLIGGNGTGKTTLLKCLYDLKLSYLTYPSDDVYGFDAIGSFEDGLLVVSEPKSAVREREWGTTYFSGLTKNFVYIPEKDILEHARGLLPFIEQKQTGFSKIYRNIIISAQDIPIKNQTELQKKIGKAITGVIGGHIEWVQSDGTFYTIRTDGLRIPFSNEASGYKKLGLLGLLVASGQLEESAILFWDEPENSLNPEHIPVLVGILLELSRNGIQVFIATHSEIFADYFSVIKQKDDCVMFHSLFSSGGIISAESNDRFDLLSPNNLTEEPVKLYEMKLDRGLGSE